MCGWEDFFANFLPLKQRPWGGLLAARFGVLGTAYEGLRGTQSSGNHRFYSGDRMPKTKRQSTASYKGDENAKAPGSFWGNTEEPSLRMKAGLEDSTGLLMRSD